MTSHSFLHGLLGAAVLLGVTALGSESAAASQSPQASIQPTTEPGVARPFFILDLTAGTTVTDSVTVVNKTPGPLTFDLYTADAFNDEQGGFVLRRSEDPKTDIGGWVRLPVDTVTVPPEAAVDIPFAIDVPGNAIPGDHAGGIVALARNAEPISSDDGSVQLQVRNGVGARIYGRVAGPTHTGLDVTRVSVLTQSTWKSRLGLPAPDTVVYEVENTGNVRLVPSVELDVDGPFGLTDRTLTWQLNELLPGQSVTIHHDLDDPRPPGRSTVRVTATAQDATARRSVTVWQVPWLVVLLVALVAGAALTLVTKRRRARRQDSTKSSESEDPAEKSPAGAAR